MKKYLFLSLIALISTFHNSVHAARRKAPQQPKYMPTPIAAAYEAPKAPQIKKAHTSLSEAQIRNYVAAQDKTLKYVGRGAAIGAVGGGLLGAGGGVYEVNETIKKYETKNSIVPPKRKLRSRIKAGSLTGVAGTVAGAMTGASTGLLTGTAVNLYRVHKIKQAITAHTNLTGKLPAYQEAFFWAAYNQDAGMLKKLAAQFPDFLNEPGVKKALTQLYFNQVPSDMLIARFSQFISE